VQGRLPLLIFPQARVGRFRRDELQRSVHQSVYNARPYRTEARLTKDQVRPLTSDAGILPFRVEKPSPCPIPPAARIRSSPSTCVSRSETSTIAAQPDGVASVRPSAVRSGGGRVADRRARIGGTACELGTKSGCSASSCKSARSRGDVVSPAAAARKVAFRTDTAPQTGVMPHTPRRRMVYSRVASSVVHT
jgi:hypothetical protein